MTYSRNANTSDDVMTVQEFRESVEMGFLIDYDGFGYPAKKIAERDAADKWVYVVKMDESVQVFPSEVDLIPKDATHIVWFNR